MRILGLDPGYALLGYGLIDKKNNQLKYVGAGAIETKADNLFQERLLQIYNEICHLLDEQKPDLVAVEELFFYKNTTTAIGTAHARGVCILACAQRSIPVFEYTPMQVKLAITGYGKSEKKQMQEMVRLLLKLPTIPKPDDAADALAIAICQANTGIRKENLVVAGYQKAPPKTLREGLQNKFKDTKKQTKK